MRAAALVAAVVIASALPVPARPGEDPLVVASRDERARRKQRVEAAAGAAVITTEDLELRRQAQGFEFDVSREPVAVEPAPPDAVGPVLEPSDDDSVPAATPDPRTDPAYWRDRMRAAHERITEVSEDLEYSRQYLLIERLELIVPVDGLREFNRKLEIDHLLAHCAALERELAEVSREPDRIHEDARRARAKPGWLRE